MRPLIEMTELSPNLLVNLLNNLHPKKLVSSQGREIIENLNDCILLRSTVPLKAIKSRKLYEIILSKLVETSNRIYRFLTRMSPIWQRSPLAPDIRILYNKVLDFLEQNIEFYRNCYNGESLIPITQNCLSQLKPNLYHTLSQVRDTLAQPEVNPYLRSVIYIGLKSQLSKRHLHSFDVKYLKRLMNGIINIDSISSYTLENFLYENKFNHPEFLKYCVSVFNYNLARIVNLYEKIEFILKFEERISNLTPGLSYGQCVEGCSLRESLRTFLDERKSFIKQSIELRVSEIEIQKHSHFHLNNNELKLSVAQLSLFIRLFMEAGIVDKKEIGKTFSFYARNFRTPKVALISAESLQKKSTSFEYSTIKAVKSHLIGMLNWLNHYENNEFAK
ncbi:hypothetical protein [Sphingobacterium hotanense]|uniref:hypothetical protein n=1 Tax=Sphingobacterium hotanense TaxID=649196 RepID=UPI0021A50031|nr:hypothetical protein [Sphingobacterium hotanense]MCT1525689.1 hypothetical protein [Sphingobacterium hotanense]